MSDFRKKVDSKTGSKFILQGNEAFALGVVHAGYHAVDGYPGTPSTEVIDKSLQFVQDQIEVGWSVNEAVAVELAVGQAVAGKDTVVTMKTPGVFQAGDPITTSAFFTAPAGALVLYVATDYVPSSTQHVIDLRYLFASSRLPVLEPRNHQEMYDIAKHAADVSKKFNTPVVVLASGILTHSEGLITTKERRTVEPRPVPEQFTGWMLLPSIARANYNHSTQVRIPSIEKYFEESDLYTIETGSDDWGIVVSGESYIIVKEALSSIGANPSIFSLSCSTPLPRKAITNFAKTIKGKLFVFEDGDRFIEERLKLSGLELIGKDEYSVITHWEPEMVIKHLSKFIDVKFETKVKEITTKTVVRPPSICPGCPYRAFGLTVAKLKRQKKIFASFGDIGCSTLLYFEKAIDTVLCMGGSDPMRQGVAIARPELAHKMISVIGDSCECHSGMDGTRNAVFRNTPGVKVILDNSITAMTGGQPAPSTPTNLSGQPHKFNLKRAVEAEGCRTVVANSYDLKAVENTMKEALELAEQGTFSTVILEGSCVHEVENKVKKRTIYIDPDKCTRCGRCNMCPGIELDDTRLPHHTNLCTNCGGNTQVCMQRCPSGAILPIEVKPEAIKPPKMQKVEEIIVPEIDAKSLPESIRVAIRGIGGQGNLFFGKILSELALSTPYADTHIVKGDTHGMAQLGGSVISTFSCGDVHSSVLSSGTADILVVMEISEVLRPNFLGLLKPGGTIIINNFKAIPPTAKAEDYPNIEDIYKELEGYNIIKIDANKTSNDLGDPFGKTANVVVLGLLSTIEPFNAIPEEAWLKALMSLSKNDFIKSANKMAFDAGRSLK